MNTDKNDCMVVGNYKVNLHMDSGNRHLHLSPLADKFLNRSSDRDTFYEINYSLQVGKTLSIPEKNLLAQLDHGPNPYRIYRMETGDYLWIRYGMSKVKLVYIISQDFNNWKLIEDNSDGKSFESFQELAYIFGYSVLNKGGILFHGVSMEWNGMGIIVCAHSKVGKTTHTRMWRDHEKALILNGDRALCYLVGEVWYTGGAPWCGSSGECLNRKAELSVVVIIEQAPVNEVILLTPLQGALELMTLTFAPAWEEKLMGYALDHIDHLVQELPVLKLRCRPDLEAVEVLKDELLKLTSVIR